MARGKGRKNESAGKARVMPKSDKARVSGGRTGGGTRESNPAKRQSRADEKAREAEPIQKSPFPRGAVRGRP